MEEASDLTMPVLAIGGEGALGQAVPDQAQAVPDQAGIGARGISGGGQAT